MYIFVHVFVLSPQTTCEVSMPLSATMLRDLHVFKDTVSFTSFLFGRLLSIIRLLMITDREIAANSDNHVLQNVLFASVTVYILPIS